MEAQNLCSCAKHGLPLDRGRTPAGPPEGGPPALPPSQEWINAPWCISCNLSATSFSFTVRAMKCGLGACTPRRARRRGKKALGQPAGSGELVQFGERSFCRVSTARQSCCLARKA